MFSQQLRKIDVVCRYGGEEFSILLSQTNPQHALAVAEKLRRMVESWQFPGVPRAVIRSISGMLFWVECTTVSSGSVISCEAMPSSSALGSEL